MSKTCRYLLCQQEEADVRLAIQEALSMMVGAYVNLQGALLNLMEALVAAYIGKVWPVTLTCDDDTRSVIYLQTHAKD